MRQHDVIDDFICKCCPKGLPRYRREMLRRELEAHVYEKAEFLVESGLSEDESALKAVESMGDPSVISQSFGKIYRFERLPAVIAFFVLTAISVIAFFTGFLLVTADVTGEYPTVVHYFISSSFVGSIVFLYIYGYRRKKAYLLLSVTVFMALSLLTVWFSSGIFQSMAVGIVVILCALVKYPERGDLNLLFYNASGAAEAGGFILASVIIALLFAVGLILTVLVFTETKRKHKTKRVRNKKPLLLHFLLIFTLVVTSTVVFSFAASRYSFMDNNFMSGAVSRMFDSKRGRDVYEKLTEGMSAAEAEKLLGRHGFTEYQKAGGVYYLPDLEPGYSKENSRVFIVKPILGEERDIYNDTVIIVAFSDDKLTYKQVYLYNQRTLAMGIRKYEDTQECYENYLTLKEGDSRNAVMKKFPASAAFLEIAYHDFESGTENIILRSQSSKTRDYRYNADIKLSFFFENGKFVNSEIVAVGSDKHYNYDELGLNSKTVVSVQ
ncbi:MAG: hypothetical protein IJN70_07815 [Clostridia bacterium]|nr:hypothetical protein [Clostridia bacterium]